MKYGLIGEKLGHSYSPTIHGFFGNKDYILNAFPREELDEFMTKKDFLGANVTIPYKEMVMPYCQLSKEALEIGCVNTIVNRDGKLYGYNTDALGFKLCASKIGIDFTGKKVIILGSGATSKTASWVAETGGAREIIKISRSGVDNYDNISKHYDADILINTTPIGMYPNNQDCPIDIAPFTKLQGVIDVLYNPLKTKLVLQCEQLGIPAIGGLTMLVGQAIYAHNLYFGLDDLSPLEEGLKKASEIFRNIALIGMPGVGKSTLGKALAKELGLNFVDTDKEITKVVGKTPAEIIKEQGEAAFRDIEAEIVAEIAKKTGQVIATGGGAVLREENRIALKQNSIIIYLHRNIENLATKNRPLSTDLTELYNQRNPIYEKLADYKLPLVISTKENITAIKKWL